MVGRSHGIHGADLVRLQTGHLARGSEPASRAATPGAQEIAVGKLSGAMGTFAHQGPDIEAYVCKARPDRRPGVQPDRAARPPPPMRRRSPCLGRRSRRSRPRCAICNGRRFWRPKNIFGWPKGIVGDAAQAQSDCVGKLCGLARLVRGPTVWRRWRMWRCGTSWTSATRRSSGSSCRIAPFSSTICWPR